MVKQLAINFDEPTITNGLSIEALPAKRPREGYSGSRLDDYIKRMYDYLFVLLGISNQPIGEYQLLVDTCPTVPHKYKQRYRAVHNTAKIANSLSSVVLLENIIDFSMPRLTGRAGQIGTVKLAEFNVSTVHGTSLETVYPHPLGHFLGDLEYANGNTVYSENGLTLDP